MEIVRTLMRIFGYLYHGVLALFLLAISFLALITDPHILHLGMLPWKAEALTYWVFFGSLLGLISVVLAVLGKLRPLFFVWSLAVTLFMLKGYFFSGYYFSKGEFRHAVLLFAGALLAMLGAWFQLRSGSGGSKRRSY